MHLVNCYHGFRCTGEPFNPNSPHFHHSAHVHDLASLDIALSRIRKTYNGIKHVWEASGWPFKGTNRYNDHLLISFNKVLLLTRKNILQRIISHHISKETGIYSLSGERGHILQQMTLASLDVDQLETQLRCERSQIQHCRTRLRNNHISFMDVSYEELFLDPVGISSQLKKLNDVITFLGGAVLSDQNMPSKMINLLDPKKNKMNSCKTYMTIPNILNIEKSYGADDTGWIFK
jgi:hypothetical protein